MTKTNDPEMSAAVALANLGDSDQSEYQSAASFDDKDVNEEGGGDGDTYIEKESTDTKMDQEPPKAEDEKKKEATESKPEVDAEKTTKPGSGQKQSEVVADDKDHDPAKPSKEKGAKIEAESKPHPGDTDVSSQLNSEVEKSDTVAKADTDGDGDEPTSATVEKTGGGGDSDKPTSSTVPASEGDDQTMKVVTDQDQDQKSDSKPTTSNEEPEYETKESPKDESAVNSNVDAIEDHLMQSQDKFEPEHVYGTSDDGIPQDDNVEPETSTEATIPNSENNIVAGNKNGKAFFPMKLYDIVSDERNADNIKWLPGGKAFIIVDKKRFASEVLPLHFQQSQFTSFTRKLSRWRFTRVPRGPFIGAYYNKLFIKGHRSLCWHMRCKNENVGKVKFDSKLPDSIKEIPPMEQSHPGHVPSSPGMVMPNFQRSQGFAPMQQMSMGMPGSHFAPIQGGMGGMHPQFLAMRDFQNSRQDTYNMYEMQQKAFLAQAQQMDAHRMAAMGGNLMDYNNTNNGMLNRQQQQQQSQQQQSQMSRGSMPPY